MALLHIPYRETQGVDQTCVRCVHDRPAMSVTCSLCASLMLGVGARFIGHESVVLVTCLLRAVGLCCWLNVALPLVERSAIQSCMKPGPEE